MNTIKTFIFSLIFALFLNNLSTACDFLGVNIGGNKSEIENYFGPIDDLDGDIVDAEILMKNLVKKIMMQMKQTQQKV